MLNYNYVNEYVKQISKEKTNELDDVEELYERIEFYRTKLYEREDIEDVVKEMLLNSNMPIWEVSKVYYILNLPDNKQPYECEFRRNENELMRVLDIPMKYKENV